jgi:hypothetical protein
MNGTKREEDTSTGVASMMDVRFLDAGSYE